MYHKSHLWNCTCRSWWLIVASILVFNCNEVLNEFQFAMPYAHLCRTHHPVISVTWSNNSEVTQHPSSNRPGSKAFIRANISWQILNCWTWGMKWKMHLTKSALKYTVYIYIYKLLYMYLFMRTSGKCDWSTTPVKEKCKLLSADLSVLPRYTRCQQSVGLQQN